MSSRGEKDGCKWMWDVKMGIITAFYCRDTVSLSWKQETLLTQLVTDKNNSENYIQE
jgi:hypothetical protein